MLLDLLRKKSMSSYIGIFMNDLAIEMKNVGVTVDHDPCDSIMHKSKTKLEKGRICGQMLDVSTDKGQLT